MKLASETCVSGSATLMATWGLAALLQAIEVRSSDGKVVVPAQNTQTVHFHYERAFRNDDPSTVLPIFAVAELTVELGNGRSFSQPLSAPLPAKDR